MMEPILSYKPVYIMSLWSILIGFYIWVFWLAFHPDVSEKYRSFYIDGSQRCWKDESIPRLSLNSQMPFGFGKPGHRCSILQRGWNIGAISWGTQSVHPESTLSLHLESDAHRQATLRFFLQGVDPLNLQTISVFRENTFTAEWQPPDQKVQSFDITVELNQTNEVRQFHFLYGHPLPSNWRGNVKNAKDDRWLGMSLLGVDWVNPDDPE